ncbi:MAG TPA: LapA family protein [Patescibacteria group bacterium]|nr:LapA family protein [Patescibacteria group bacterium]
MAWLTWIITLPLTIFAVLFAVSNHADVTVGLWPFEKTLAVQSWLLALGMLGAGFFLGALFVWILSTRTRVKYWQEQRRASRLEKELEKIQGAAPAKIAANSETLPPPAVPALAVKS